MFDNLLLIVSQVEKENWERRFKHDYMFRSVSEEPRFNRMRTILHKLGVAMHPASRQADSLNPEPLAEASKTQH